MGVSWSFTIWKVIWPSLIAWMTYVLSSSLLYAIPLVMNLSNGISKVIRPYPKGSRGGWGLAGVSKAEGGRVSRFGDAGDI